MYKYNKKHKYYLPLVLVVGQEPCDVVDMETKKEVNAKFAHIML